MNYYIELTLIADTHNNINVSFLWQKLYQQLHLAFVEVKDANNQIHIGVSFPEYTHKKRGLGKKLRLFGQDKSNLEALDLNKLLKYLRDYIHVKSIQKVPKNIKGYAVFKRIHDKGNIEKLARRRILHLKKKGVDVTYQQALDYFANSERLQSKQILEKMPFINMHSLSTKQRYSLFIDCEKVSEATTLAIFNTYGLSSTKNKSVLPLF